jgi:aspartate kinase
VGNIWADKEGIAIKVLDAIKSIPIRMISYGASEHNISLLVDASHKNDALNALNEGLFLK